MFMLIPHTSNKNLYSVAANYCSVVADQRAGAQKEAVTQKFNNQPLLLIEVKSLSVSFPDAATETTSQARETGG